MTSLEPTSLVLSIGMAIAAGLVGCFAVMRRMTLAADAISHIALPGIGVALIFRLQPIIGALVMLLVGTLLIWALEHRTRIPTETITGVVFSVALAVGSLMSSGEELIDALFGGPGKLTNWELGLGLIAVCAITAFIFRARHALVLSLVSPEIALTSGVNVSRLDLFYLLTFGLTVGLGLRYLGVLLMGSLIIIPAAAAKRLAQNLNGMLAISVVIAVFSTISGSYVALFAHRETGPIIIAIAGALFFLSLLRPQAG
jgi:ABC-type Mn2+/Zn2+ transport system permease subunit